MLWLVFKAVCENVLTFVTLGPTIETVQGDIAFCLTCTDTTFIFAPHGCYHVDPILGCEAGAGFGGFP